MTTSKKRPLCSLLFASGADYEENLALLESLIAQTPEEALVVAPEVCLSNFDYEHFEAAAAFAPRAIERLLAVTRERIVVVSLIEKRAGGIFNVAKVLHKGRVVHEQAKSRLFHMGEEHEHFAPGDESQIALIEVDGVLLGVLICFELRFKHLWQKLEGADVIAVTAQWGKLRTSHFVTLTEALAVMNQCYVIASDSANDAMTGMSGVITPFGEAFRNGNAPCLVHPFDEKEVRRMRRYLDVGIHAR